MRRYTYHRKPLYTNRDYRNTWKGLISPDDTPYRNIPDLHSFCLAHHLDYQSIYQLAQRKRDEVDGWKRLE